MKKISLLIMSFVCVLLAYAADYPYLVFTNTSGTNTSLSVSNLKMSISGSELTVTNDDGSVSFTLTDLSAMQFSTSADTITAIENVLDGDQEVNVFSVSGIYMGRFSNMLNAASSLNPGSYIVCQGNNAQTIIIR